MRKIYTALLLTLLAFTAQAQFPAPYCTEVFPSGVEPITLVAFNTINNPSPAALTGATALENFTSISTTVQRGSSYSMQVKGNTDGDYEDFVVAFIDFNNNGVFTDAGESFTIGSLVNSTGTDAVVASANISIPPAATIGALRMRISKKYGLVPTPCNAATPNVPNYGQAEDYTLNVVAGTPCSGTPTAGGVSPVSAISCNGGAITLTSTSANVGTGITYQWQSSPAVANNYTNIAGATSGTYAVTPTANTNYRVIITCSSSGLSATSTIATVTPSTAAVNLISPTNGNNTVNNVFTLVWNRFTGATSYDLYINTTTPPTFFSNTTDTTITLSSSVGNTPFYWSVVPVNSTGGAVGCSSPNYMFTTRSTPSNDSCGAAIVISRSVATVGEITGATASPVTTVTCNATAFTPTNDVWYRVTALSNGTASISVTANYGNGFNPVIAAYSGTCSAPVLLSCSNASTTTTETLALTGLVAGNSYLIRVFASGTVANGGFTITATGPALPVTGVTLSAIRNGSKTQLSWKTLTEINNAGFELQRSADGKNFSGIASVASKATSGNSTAAITYNYDDVRPLAGANYYRLKQTDKDGKTSYSNIVYLKGIAVSNLTVSAIYPNPTRDVLKASVQAPAAETITFIVTDMMGKTISRQLANITSGDNTVNINVANLPSGSYLLKAVCRNGCETAYQKFTRQ